MVASDTHFHDFNFGSYVTPEGINSRLKATIDEFERGADELEQQGGRDIVITGDLFHVRGLIDPMVFNPVMHMFERLSKRGFRVHAIPGNHDLAEETATEVGNSFHAFTAIPNFKVYYQATYLTMEGGVAVFFPWGRLHQTGISALADSLAVLPSQKITIFCHEGLSGVISGVNSTIDPSIFNLKEIKYVFSGHFHNHKRFDFTCPNGTPTVFSVGALTHQSFKDVGSLAGFLIVNNDEVEHHPSQAPQFLDINFDLAGMLTEELEEYVGNFCRIPSDRSLRSEEVLALKTTLQNIGALRVICRAQIDDTMVDMGDFSPNVIGATRFVIRGDEKSISKQLESYINSKYEKALADKINNILDKENFDE